MKKLNVILLMAMLLFISCSKKEVAQEIINPPDREMPDKPIDDDKTKKDHELYGKTILLDNVTYTIDKFEKKEYRSGMDYMQIQIDQQGNQKLKLLAHVLRVDRDAFTNDLTFEALKGGKYIADKSAPNKIMKDQTNTQRDVLAVLNGDFFNTDATGTMLGAMVNQGRVIKTANSSWKLAYGFTENNDFFIDELKYTVTIGDDNYPINEINGGRGENNLILYTTDKGTNTGANEWGSEILLKPVTGDWESLEDYENVLCEVVSNAPAAVPGGIAIPKGHFALSAHGTGIAICNKYRKGDKVSIKVGKPKGASGKVYDVREAIGAAYSILKDGNIISVVSPSGNPGGKEPRSAVGHSTKYLYFVAVEGRSEVSDGLTVKNLSYLLKHFGATDAVNMDGGGSTMLAFGENIYGQPAGTTWFRPVPNALAIVKYKKD